MKEIESTILELLNKHPKSAQIVMDYFVRIMIDSFEDSDVPEEIKNTLREQGISPVRMVQIISGAPRCLFDIFDENEIYIIIYRTNGDSFTFDIENYVDHPDHYCTRKECELMAIKESFSILEQKEMSHEGAI